MREFTISETLTQDKVKAFETPCGKIIPRIEIEYGYKDRFKWIQYDKPKKRTLTQNDIIKDHCETCIECKIIAGYSKQKTLTQQQVANLFGLGIDGKQSSTNNFNSSDGVLYHYGTIEAIRLIDGTVIKNTQCWNAGFAYCSTPRNVKYRLPLSAINRIRDIYIRKLAIIDENEHGEILFNCPTTKNETLLYGIDEHQFLVELAQDCKTIKEAKESMKPNAVKIALAHGRTVKRQGELFFIELSEQLTKLKVTDIKTRTRTKCMRAFYQCKKCGIKTERFITQDTEQRYTGRIESAKYHPHLTYWQKNTTQKQRNCNGQNEDMKFIEYDSFEYSAFPQIRIRDGDDRPLETRHTATRIGVFRGNVVLNGCIRHSEHKTLNLGEKWHAVAPNVVKRSIPLQRGGAD